MKILMKKAISTLIIVFCISLSTLLAQNQYIPQDTTINLSREVEVDTLLAGRQIFSLLGESFPGGGTAIIR